MESISFFLQQIFATFLQRPDIGTLTHNRIGKMAQARRDIAKSRFMDKFKHNLVNLKFKCRIELIKTIGVFMCGCCCVTGSLSISPSLSLAVKSDAPGRIRPFYIGVMQILRRTLHSMHSILYYLFESSALYALIPINLVHILQYLNITR